MDLILWRHATAEDAQAPGRDADLARALTRRGEREAKQVAAWLKPRLPGAYTVIASPARRARETAAALAPDHRVVDAIAPGASPEDVLAAAGWPAAGGTVVVVGHQPTLGHTIALVVGGRAAEWSIRKGGLWWLADRDRDAGAALIVRAVVSPDLA